jgi:hypothetical protein
MVPNQVDSVIPGHLISQILVKIPPAPLFATYLLIRRKEGIFSRYLGHKGAWHSRFYLIVGHIIILKPLKKKEIFYHQNLANLQNNFA